MLIKSEECESNRRISAEKDIDLDQLERGMNKTSRRPTNKFLILNKAKQIQSGNVSKTNDTSNHSDQSSPIILIKVEKDHQQIVTSENNSKTTTTNMSDVKPVVMPRLTRASTSRSVSMSSDQDRNNDEEENETETSPPHSMASPVRSLPALKPITSLSTSNGIATANGTKPETLNTQDSGNMKIGGKLVMWKCKKCQFQHKDKDAVRHHLRTIHSNKLSQERKQVSESSQSSGADSSGNNGYNDELDSKKRKLDASPTHEDMKSAKLPRRSSTPSSVSTTNSSGITKYTCAECPYITACKSQYYNHGKFHLPRENAPFKCTHCSYNVTHKHLLLQHVRVHGILDLDKEDEELGNGNEDSEAGAEDGKVADHTTSKRVIPLGGFRAGKSGSRQHLIRFGKKRVAVTRTSGRTGMLMKKQQLQLQASGRTGVRMNTGNPVSHQQSILHRNLQQKSMSTTQNQQQSTYIPKCILVWPDNGVRPRKVFKCTNCNRLFNTAREVRNHEEVAHKLGAGGPRQKMTNTQAMPTEKRIVKHEIVDNNDEHSDEIESPEHESIIDHQPEVRPAAKRIIRPPPLVQKPVSPTNTGKVQQMNAPQHNQGQSSSSSSIPLPFLHYRTLISNQTNPFAIQCTKCDTKLANTNEYKIHNKQHGLPQSAFRCSFCDYGSGNAIDLAVHKIFHAGAEIKIVQNDKDRNVANLVTSMINRGKNTLKISTVNTNVANRNSPQRNSITGTSLLKPSLAKTNLTAEQILRQRGIIQGQQFETGFRRVEKPKPHACPKCPCKFSKRDRYELHLKQHGSNQKYTCYMCDFSVNLYVNYSQHVKRHQALLEDAAENCGNDAHEEDSSHGNHFKAYQHHNVEGGGMLPKSNPLLFLDVNMKEELDDEDEEEQSPSHPESMDEGEGDQEDFEDDPLAAELSSHQNDDVEDEEEDVGQNEQDDDEDGEQQSQDDEEVEEEDQENESMENEDVRIDDDENNDEGVSEDDNDDAPEDDYPDTELQDE